jgi:hypothetical protein
VCCAAGTDDNESGEGTLAALQEQLLTLLLEEEELQADSMCLAYHQMFAVLPLIIYSLYYESTLNLVRVTFTFTIVYCCSRE